MKKKVVSTVLCAAMVASMFAGCGNKAADNSSAADNSAADNSAAESTNSAAATETGDAADNAETASGDAIANLIASTDGTVDIQLWCSELEAYQNVMKELTDKFKEQYSDVDLTSRSVLYLRQMQKIRFLRISMQQQMYSYLQMIR